MKLVFGIALIACFSFANAQRIKYNFNSGWEVFVGKDTANANWKKVTLPYAWNEDEAFKKDIAEFSTGIAWYRKHFSVPVSYKNQKVFLEFEGIRQAGEFYLNGKYIGLHENGVTAFGFDVTDLVRFGEDNIITARIDNDWDYKEKSTNTKFQWEDRNFNANYGGINKNVYLHITPKIYQTLPLYSSFQTTGVYVYADSFNIRKGSASIHAVAEVKNETGTSQKIEYSVEARDVNGKLINSFKGASQTIAPGKTEILSASSIMNGLHFWSWGYGYLYTIKTILKTNGKIIDSVNTKTGFRKTAFKEGMIWLNDRVIQVHGYAQRTSNEWPAIGLSVPPWMSDYSNGLMVEGNGNLVRWMHITPSKQDVESCDRVGLMQAMPAGDAERDVDDKRWEQRKKLMQDAIVYNRNNPSIIFYECGNESISEEHMRQMKAIRDLYDPYGGRSIGSREMLDSKVAEYGGEMLYINKSDQIPMWAMEYSRDEGLRKYWDDYSPPYHRDGDGPLYKNQPANEYNRNQESHAVENVLRWYDFWKERPGTGRRVSSGGVNIIFSETNTHHRGAENYRRSGEVDALRIFKENYFANQVMWDGWVDIEKPRIHIIGHWNYTLGVKKNIYVVSSADKVELIINGRSLGYGEQSNRFLYTFKDVEWQAGTLSAVGFDENGKEVCYTSLFTALEPVALKLHTIKNPKGLQADGHDIAIVEVEVVDIFGRRCPVAMNMINFRLDGPAEWRGGMAQGPDNYILSKDLPVECGVNRVLIRSTTNTGTITVKASAEGLKPATISFTSKKYIVENGLSKTLPGNNLVSQLKRGATPATPSFTITRIPVRILKAVAGAKSDSAFASFDNNELSGWVNDGQLSTAWIEYELEREAIVSEVNLKLNNFRTRTYPLRITVDGKEVFSDTTKRSLGYFNAQCRPVKGKKLRLELVKTNQKDSAVLNIIEVEVYEAIRKPQPNIIFILADDLGYGDVGSYGQQKIKTPNIDRLAQLGMKFTEFYSGSTVCAPARSTFMTGLHTGHTPIRGNKTLKPEGQVPLPDSIITIAMRLQQQGYITGAFGKWSLGFITTSGDPQKKGFDEFYGYNCQTLAHDYYPDHLWHNHDRIDLSGNLKWDSAYSADLIHQQALQFLETKRDQPFFLYLPYTLPHADLNVPHDDVFANYLQQFKDTSHASFAAMVSRLDKYVGEIWQAVKEMEQEENTIIVFASDNGPHKEGGGDPAFFNSNAGFRGIKRDLYEGGIRVPMIVYQKGKIKSSVYTKPFALYDLYPTFLELSGAKLQEKIDGISLLPALSGKDQPQHSFLYWELHEAGGKQAVRMGKWKAVKNNVMNDKQAPMELYDLILDPKEKNNIATKFPEIMKQMEKMMKEAYVPDPSWPFLE